ncbi:MAG: T9SS type A sorting domain-containing protein, partial [Bacteroidetes bacterium]|nr:T9SS type A sorting domain-containing protein [Bacteroidota bacterium]
NGWAIGSDVGETQQVNVRAWYPNPRLKNLPNTDRQKNIGYYRNANDPNAPATPFLDLATDTAWVYPPKSRDSLTYAFDPLGVEATWKKGGVNVPVTSYSWHSLDMLSTGDTMKFLENQLIGFTILNNATSANGIRQEILSAPLPDHPYHSFKFYPNGRLSAIDRGWWMRGDFEWGMYMVVEYTKNPRPKIITKRLLNTATTQPRPVTAAIKVEKVSDPVDVKLFSRINAQPWQSSAMTRTEGFDHAGTLPSAQPGDSMFYYYTATDSGKRTTTSPTFAYAVLKKKKPLLLLYNGKNLPTGIVDPTIYLKYTMKTDFGAEPYYDFCDISFFTVPELHTLMEQYSVILEVTGDGSARDLTHYSGEWLKNSATLPAGAKRYYLLSDQDHGIISNYQDTVFTGDDPHAEFFGVQGIVNQDFPKIQNIMKEVTFPWQLTATPKIAGDPVFGFIPAALAKDTVTLWYHPYYEVPLYTNRMDQLAPAENGTVIFTDSKNGYPVGITASDPNGKWRSYFLAFDWMALDVRSDTSSVLYEYPFLDPKYQWISDIQNIGKTLAALAGPTAVTAEHNVPHGFSLGQNYPNPFNPVTTIPFSIPANGHAELAVFDLLGRKVQTLHRGWIASGAYTVTFDGSTLPSGLYLCRLSAGDRHFTRKLLLVK